VSLVDITERKKAEQIIKASEQNYRTLIDSANDGIFVLNGAGFLDCNRQGAELFGLRNREQLLGYSPADFSPERQPDGRLSAEVASEIMRAVLTGKTRRFEWQLRCADGTLRDVDNTLNPVEYHGEPCILAIVRDITAHKLAESNLKLAANVFSHAREGILITDKNAIIIDVNQAFCDITGYNRDEVIGQNPRMLQSGKQSKDFYALMWKTLIEKGHWYGELWNRRKNGEVYAELITISAVYDGGGRVTHYVGLFSDITAMKAHQAQLEHIARFDPLTSLPNRLLFSDRLQQALIHSQRRGSMVAVAYVDLDGFKVVNDTYGHQTGDELLIAISARMKDALRKGETLARIGGMSLSLFWWIWSMPPIMSPFFPDYYTLHPIPYELETLFSMCRPALDLAFHHGMVLSRIN